MTEEDFQDRDSLCSRSFYSVRIKEGSWIVNIYYLHTADWTQSTGNPDVQSSRSEKGNHATIEKEVQSIVFYGFPLLWNRKLHHSYEHVRLAAWQPPRLGADALGTKRELWPGTRTQSAKQLCNPARVVTEPATPAQGQWEGWQLAWSLPS